MVQSAAMSVELRDRRIQRSFHAFICKAQGLRHRAYKGELTEEEYDSRIAAASLLLSGGGAIFLEPRERYDSCLLGMTFGGRAIYSLRRIRKIVPHFVPFEEYSFSPVFYREGEDE